MTVDAGSYLLIPVGIGSAHNRANCNVVVYASQAVLVEEQPEIEIPVSTIKEVSSPACALLHQQGDVTCGVSDY